jgi:ribosomal protein L37AE/L43A
MALQHAQFNCHTCRRATMHVRNEADVNHVLHLLASVFLCGLWLPVWFLIALHHSLTAGAVWRCQNCGSTPRFFGGPGAAPMAMLPVRPAGPSSRAKCQGDKCPQCGGAMIAGVELGEAVLSCPGCGETFERAGE